MWKSTCARCHPHALRTIEDRQHMVLRGAHHAFQLHTRSASTSSQRRLTRLTVYMNMNAYMQLWLVGLPDVTKATLGTCSAVHILGLATSRLPAALCFSVHHVFKGLQLHRVLLAPLTHTTLLQLGLDLAAFSAVAPALEAAMGSVRFGCSPSTL
jgi:membrane associated rhomboid family serine protease